MAQAIHGSNPPTTPFSDLGPWFLGSVALTDGLLFAQRLQWETLLAWQKAAAAMQQEWLDEWVSHFGGGIPIDV